VKPFLRWWLIISGIVVGFVFLVINDGFNYINESDFTKLSFVIFIGFIYFSIKTGLSTFKGIDKLDASRFAVGVFTKLGMVGTVLGFISMLSTCFANVNFQSIASIQSVLGQMVTGMSTALVTTAAGLICSLLLHLQIFNFDQGNKYKKVSKKISKMKQGERKYEG